MAALAEKGAQAASEKEETATNGHEQQQQHNQRQAGQLPADEAEQGDLLGPEPTQPGQQKRQERQGPKDHEQAEPLTRSRQGLPCPLTFA